MRAPTGYLDPAPKAGNAMPYDKPTTPRTLAPTLSHSSLRGGSTIPLTPRVAGTAPLNASTPLLRRATRPDIGMASPPRQDGTPKSNILSPNITPRSGSRTNRVNSTNTTSSGTPNGTLHPEAFAGEILSYEGGSGRSNAGSPYLKPAATFNSSGRSEVGGSRRDRTQSSQDDGKFFYASDVKASPAPSPRPRPLAHKQSGLLHAKGSSSKASGSMVSGYSSGASSIGRSEEKMSKAKFFHANGTPDATLPLPSVGYSRAGSTVSSSSLSQPPRLAPAKGRSLPHPVSLQKMDNTSSYFSPKAVASAQTSPVLALPNVSPHVTGNRRSVQEERSEARRVMSSHKKSQSMTQSTSTNAGISMMDVRSSVGSSIGSDLSSTPSSHPQYLAEVVNTPDISTPLEENGPEDAGSDIESMDDATIATGSPLKADSNIERMKELAAEARRERKVMDLEITNSSLAAINRTLEREMRKQKAELQRYRRLSRSGRLSIIPGSTKPKKLRQSLLSVLSELGEEDEDMDEDDEDSDDEEDSEEDEKEDLDEDEDEEELSPAAQAVSDAKHKKRDEERLALDLSKHQQLLVDSQKMNQSLKKCLGWTEELIKDGKKALAYKVNAEDVKLGGRILVDDDHEEHDDEQMEEYEVKGEYFVEDEDGADTSGSTVKGDVDRKSYGRNTPGAPDRPSEDFQSDP